MPPKKAAADAAAKAGGAGTAKAGDPEEILLDVRGNASFNLATFSCSSFSDLQHICERAEANHNYILLPCSYRGLHGDWTSH